MVDTFIESKNTFFCSCIIPYSATKLVHYSGIDTNQKRIKIYSDGAKLLILNNIPKDANCDIYFDEEDRIKKTKLYSKLLKAKPVHGGNILSVQPTISSDESRNVLQLCDILTGAIKQNLYPSNTNKSALKREFSAYVLKENGLEGCGEEYWKKSQKRKNHKLHTKFYISHFEIPLTRLI